MPTGNGNPNPLVFVSAGLKAPKKGNGVIFRRQRYLNYGLLSLANSIAAPTGSVFHGHFDSPEETLLRIETSQRLDLSPIFLLSCPSFLGLHWTREFVELASRKYSSARFVLGGRWVVDGNQTELHRQISRIDHLFDGIGEERFSEFMRERFGLQYERTATASGAFSKTKLSYLDYNKLSNPEEFVPSFEGSRGCGAGCRFCAEAAVRLTPLKPPSLLCSEISDYQRDVPNGVRRFYMEASNFTPRLDWIDAFIQERRHSELTDVQWRTEARVDFFSQKSIEALSRAGLKVLDLGLESACPEQLLRMSKTRDPRKYLERCGQLIKTASECGILTKLNVLLFPGETEATIAETTGWLNDYRNFFAGVSVYPTVYYGLASDSDPVLGHYASLGATLVDGPAPGIHHINLSGSIPYPHSEFLARRLSQEFMTDEQYFTLKSFSYFDPSYSDHQFRADIEDSDATLLPFKVTAWARFQRAAGLGAK